MIPYSGDILLGPIGQELLLSRGGRTFTEGRIKLSREERTASGRLVEDIIATKKIFRLEYSLIDGDHLREIIAIYDLATSLSLIVYEEYDEKNSYTVIMRPFDRTRILSVGEGLWGNVTFELEQV